MLACMLLAAALGGVAAANPGAWSIAEEGAVDAAAPDEGVSEGDPDGASTSGPSGGSTHADPGTAGSGDSAGQAGPDGHSKADCREAVALVEGDLPSVGEASGLASAVYTLWANCEAKLTAPGSLQSLTEVVRHFRDHHGKGSDGVRGGGNGGQPSAGGGAHGGGPGGTSPGNGHGGTEAGHGGGANSGNAGGGNDGSSGGHSTGGQGATPQTAANRPRPSGGAPVGNDPVRSVGDAQHPEAGVHGAGPNVHVHPHID
jgi:hypothetical protein